ncbi:MAG: hypothetical protein JXB23_00450 [Candidatus Aminicenantes bacterium]|nr:hypothetical protein [Candidatus Aminicenantes bacterium]
MKTKRVKEWELERYLLGELPQTRMKEIGRLLQQDAPLRTQLSSLQKSDENILRAYPAERMIPEIQNKYQRQKTRAKKRPHSRAIRSLLYASPAFAAALILLFIVVFKSPVSQDFRIKGTDSIDMTKSQILIYKKIGDDVLLLQNGDVAHKGDLLQLAYVAAGQPFGVIFSIDGNGMITLHYPDDGLSSTKLLPNESVPLGTSYELDDAPGYERFFFVTAQSEINVIDILELAEKLAENPEEARKTDLDLPSSYRQDSVLIEKGE